LTSIRPLHRPVESSADARDATTDFDVRKGAEILRMVESWVGADKFRLGIQHYVKAHSYGIATVNDFVSTISDEAGSDLGAVFSTFLDQSGVPLVTMKPRCKKGVAPIIEVSQGRYLPTGSDAPADAANVLWQVPLCIRWAGRGGGQPGHLCTLFTTRSTELTLSELDDCPEWVAPNADSIGYYRYDLGGDLLPRLMKTEAKALNPVERIGLLGDLGALTRAGRVPISTTLNYGSKLAQENNRHLVEASIDTVERLDRDLLIAPASRPKYARLITATFGKRAHSLGWTPRKDDDEDSRLLRIRLLPFVGNQGDDTKLVEEARKATDGWLKDRTSVAAETVDALLLVAAEHGDAALFERLEAALLEAKDPLDKEQLLRALGEFRVDALVKRALAFTLRDDVDARAARRLLEEVAESPKTRPMAFDFIKSNFDKLLARDAPVESFLVSICARTCDEDHAGAAETFLKELSSKPNANLPRLTEARENLRLCSAFRRSQAPAVAAFLSAR
jgi:alanyl aminopeptidase